jgi:hypothetical protein
MSAEPGALRILAVEERQVEALVVRAFLELIKICPWIRNKSNSLKELKVLIPRPPECLRR